MQSRPARERLAWKGTVERLTMIRRMVVAIAVLGAVLVWPLALAGQGGGRNPQHEVRFLGIRTGMGTSGNQCILYIEPMEGGQREEVPLAADQKTIDFFQKLAPRQPMRMWVDKTTGRRHISAAPPKPGEKEPDTAYIKGVEVRKMKDRAVTVLTLVKFDRTTLVEVPKVQAKEGPETSPILLKAIKAIKPGTLVEVVAEPPKRGSRVKMPVLTFITPWAPWRVGAYSKLGKKKIDKTYYVTVEVKSAGIPMTLLLPKTTRSGGGLGDGRAMLKLLRKCKKGQPLEYKIRQDGLNQFIRKIRAGTARK